MGYALFIKGRYHPVAQKLTYAPPGSGQTVSQQKSSKQRQLINDVCLNLNVQLYRGMLMIRLKQSEDLAEAVMRLSQAALRVSDLWFIFKNQTDGSAADEVKD